MIFDNFPVGVIWQFVSSLHFAVRSHKDPLRIKWHGQNQHQPHFVGANQDFAFESDLHYATYSGLRYG